MAKLEIVKGADNEILRAMSVPVEDFGEGLAGFVQDMYETMVEANGLGIAAPQVGKNVRVFIVTLNYNTDDEVAVAMINPEIKLLSAATNIKEEGCLSLPGVFGKVARATDIKVEFYDLMGEKEVLELSGLNARVVQHETDHLNGVLFIDKLAEKSDLSPENASA